MCISACLPRFNQSWDDQREWDDVKKENRGIVVDKTTNYKYGVVTGDSNLDLVMKFVEIPIGQGLMAFYRPAYRALGILTADWLRTGCPLAKREWLLARQAWSQNPTTKSKLPGRISLVGKVIKHSLWQLIKNVVKAVTYPLASIAIAFACLVGLIFNLQTGRKWVSKIEDAWSRDLIRVPGQWMTAQITFGEYLAPCMLPEHIIEKQNAMHSGGPRANLLSYSIFMKQFLQNEGVAVDTIIKGIEGYRNWYKQTTDDVKNEKQPKAYKLFTEILKDLKKIESARERTIRAQLIGNDPVDQGLVIKESINSKLNELSELLK